MVKPDSVLFPTNITTGKWTIDQDCIAYHSLTSDNGYVKVFSLKESDTRVINSVQKENKVDEFESPLLVKDGEQVEKAPDSLAVVAPSEQVIDSAESIKEEDMFEDLKLSGTYIKTIKLQKCQDFSYTSFLTFDHTYKKFYFLLIGSTHRFIAVSQDLS